MIVIYAPAAEPGLQSRAVFSLPVHFEGFNAHLLIGAAYGWGGPTEIERNLRRAIRLQHFCFARVAKHRYKRLIHVEKLSFRVAPADSVGGIVDQGSIQRLRMPQGFPSLFQLDAKFLFIQDAPNGHGQLREMLAYNVIERAVSGQLGEAFTPGRGSYEEKRDLLDRLPKELQCLRTLPVGAGVLSNYHVIAVGVELLSTLRYVQHQVRAETKARFFEFLLAGVYNVRIAVDKKNADWTMPMGSRGVWTIA